MNNTFSLKGLTSNKYDYFLILFIGLLVFGLYGGPLQPIRVVSLALIPFIIISFFVGKEDPFIRHAYAFCILLFSFIILSFGWTMDMEEGFKQLFYYFSHLSLFLLIILFYSKASKPFTSLLKGWVFFIVLTQVIALTEIFFYIHLDVSFLTTESAVNFYGNGINKSFASVTFGNYNTYVTIITMALPFLFGFLYYKKRLTQQIFMISIIGICFYILIVNASRGGIFAGFIVLFIWFFLTIKRKINHLKEKLLVFTPILLIVIIKYTQPIFKQITSRLSTGTSLTEDHARLSIFKSALEAFYKKPFLGGGVGSVKMEMQGALAVVPHNLFLEFLVEFGMIATIALVILFLVVFRGAFQKSFIKKLILISILISLPIVTIINSTYLLHPVLWVFIASIYCISKFNPEKSHL